jgi:hypothetical protein
MATTKINKDGTATFVINNISGGIGATLNNPSANTYLRSLGIDPDLPVSAYDIKTGGAITPNPYSKFTGTAVDSPVIAVIAQPKTASELVYLILLNGKIISYTGTLGTETLVGQVAGNNAGGAAYYNNYIYIFGTGASKNDVSRYGPLSNSPALVDAVWTGVTLGSQTALTNTTYPQIGLLGYVMPNHWAFAHIDGALYFLDYAGGKGYVHKIKTKKTTDEGDTNDNSAYGVLVLPVGYIPTCITGYGEDLVIGEMLNNAVATPKISTGSSQIIFWDTTSDTFYNTATIPDPFLTALLTRNNEVFIFSGNSFAGMRVLKYAGGRAVSEVVFLENSWPPFVGAVDSASNRIIWGGCVGRTDVLGPSSSCVFSYGSKNAQEPDVLHCPIKTSSAGNNSQIMALKYVLQSSNITPKPIVAWVDASTRGADKYDATAISNATWQSNYIPIGHKFVIQEVRINLASPVSANSNISVTLYIDSGTSTATIPSVVNAPVGTFNYIKKNPKVTSTTVIGGYVNLGIGFQWTDTNSNSILSVELTVNIYEDEPSV